MNFTENYIKQMEKSPVQEEWKPKWGDRTNMGIVTQIFVGGDLGLKTEGGECRVSRDLVIWYPTSDDWWEMIENINPILWGDNHIKIREFERFSLKWSCVYTNILELLSAFWHSERGLKWEEGEWR